MALFCLNFVFPQGIKKIFKNFPSKEFKYGLDLKGGVRLVYQVDLSKIKKEEKGDVLEGLKSVLERRVNYFGVKEPVVQIQGEKIVVEISGEVDPEKAVKEIGKTPYLVFKEQKENFNEIIEKNKKAIEEGRVNEIEDPFQETELTGRYLKSARMAFDSSTGKPVVSLEFNDEGAKIFSKLTEKNVGKILAIYIDNQPISEPVVREKIPGGRAQIEGNFSVEEARELARNLSAGALPAPISLLSQKTVGAILGEKTFFNILRAGFFAVLTLLIFMILYYRLFGFLIFFPLFVYFSFSLFIFLIFGVTLSLSAIAGFLLSLGMAIDANILIFSRTREELEKGDFLFAIREGIKRAWPAIRDGNGTTLLVNIILFYFGESFVRGFALTLSLGILVSLFTQILIYKLMAEIVAGTRLSKIKVLWK